MSRYVILKEFSEYIRAQAKQNNIIAYCSVFHNYIDLLSTIARQM